MIALIYWLAAYVSLVAFLHIVRPPFSAATIVTILLILYWLRRWGYFRGK